jgi:hypothetical protein
VNAWPLLVAAATIVQGAAPVAPAQDPPAPPPIRTEKASGFEVQFVGTPWRPDVFLAMESGGSDGERQRSWAFARLDAGWYFAIDGRMVPPGHYALTLNPKTGSLPMTLELRRADGSDFLGDPTTMPSPPAGESVYKAPAVFAATNDPVPVLDLTLARGGGGVTLTIRYGNRKLTKDLVRTEP